METLKQKQGEESVKLEKRKKAIEIELSEIEPLVQEAKDAVGNIKPESLSEIRSLRMPPDVIRDILEGVLRLMGIFDTSWVSMKRYRLIYNLQKNYLWKLEYSTNLVKNKCNLQILELHCYTISLKTEKDQA